MARIQAGSTERLLDLSQRSSVRVNGVWTDPATLVTSFDEMTVAQLKDHAAAHDIDLGGATKKADIINAIQEA